MNTSVFLKWAGGKRRILDKIDKELPDKINRYFEPFLGAGAVFFYVKEKYNPKFCLISDINKDLIDAYIAVRDNVGLLMKYLREYREQNSKAFYLGIRDKYNKGRIWGINRSAAFIYINKTCFNGIYRVNSKNEFNVPYGRNKSVSIFEKEYLLKASELLKGVNIVRQDYREIIDKVEEDDLVYLDPCYDPLKKTSFANYTPERFNLSDREKLFKFVESLTVKKTKMILSNNALDEIRRLYKKDKYKIIEIMVSRPINSMTSSRGAIPEFLIKNY
ncbi:hypothetical protein A2303_05490 [Candidatus Falkowbacteria bacterium RIFOXYB2_FULL_47_14]|uniref:site-specific DNA-methyltransferase (adenine-specific) n=1 Tax=Candidatus Falkowbacteria bacterium RIFOXYA2_FULL_47_19 TaxID=1797994 RepID=A0A1F5SED3_9BACT|nr:MAG: hypothetical protein A2227_06895 [Candidatus Falkowbacteria bacterium RIFOXYA2_FULL_47_19]OGF35303.1 MAG: hypothetical protein A2468_00045 [Candidatus Falkowbacteria bacterium RIFOXYC2_FULL_46_15]OGF43740.1 MAG: hypothetical protein A2303_05490 [Candidatus Falkowbacteria bacterium RIFOXYB2_FULL_47_14]